MMRRSSPVRNEWPVLSTHGAVRVLRFASAPGELGPMHTHPPHFAYVPHGGTVRFAYPDGKRIKDCRPCSLRSLAATC